MVPTADADVRAVLRKIGEPAVLFGEENFARRDRLKKMMDGMTRREREQLTAPAVQSVSVAPIETFYTYGTEELQRARELILVTSRSAAVERLKQERLKLEADPELMQWKARNLEISTAPFTVASEVGDSRPLSCISFSPDGSAVAVAGWSGAVNVFGPGNLNSLAKFKPSDLRCHSLAWSGSRLLAGYADGRIFSLDGDLEICNHEGRVNKLATVPFSDNFFISAGSDETWKLWDLNRPGNFLIEQEGHAAPVHALSIHPDGSLVASGDAQGVLHLWDLRSGKQLLSFPTAHAGEVVTCDFSATLLASGGADGHVKVWDLRQRRLAAEILAHEKLVSSVRFAADGGYLVSSGFDAAVKLWNPVKKWSLIRNFQVHEARVAGADLGPAGEIAAACSDRTFKIWKRQVRMKIEQ